jgi:hypothetical protein
MPARSPRSPWPLARWILAALAALAALASPDGEARGPSDRSLIVWTELGPAGTIARAITTDTTCPDVRLDGGVQPMHARATPAPPEFPVLVCEVGIPASARTASIDGRALPLLGSVRRIVVIGDTGCRIIGSLVQACNDPTQWPFAQIASSAAAWRPELIIHVGDYIYREDPCPAGDAGCAGSPHGDNWETLRTDFFTPAAPLLRAAPWVFMRGNHEICARGGTAWFRVLSPLPLPGECVDYTEPYQIRLDRFDLLVLDSAIANDFQIPPDQVAAYQQQFDAVRRMATRESWLLTHKPIYAFGHAGVKDGVEQLFIDQEVLQAASENDFPATIQLFIGGHLHSFETLAFGSSRPPQIVVGNSGTLLDQAVSTPLPGLTIAGMTVAGGVSLARFGFMTLEAIDGGWHAVLRDVAGAPLLECALRGRDLTCGSPDRRPQ